MIHSIVQRLPVAASLATLSLSSAAYAVPVRPDYTATADISPDSGASPGVHLGFVTPYADTPARSPNPVSQSADHISILGTGSKVNSSSSPANGGTVRATATTADERAAGSASVRYGFVLQPKAGVTAPTVIPLHVFAAGGTGTEGYSQASITFILDYYDAPDATATKNIFENTGVTSTPLGIATYGGNGSINVDSDINVAVGRDLTVYLSAAAGAGVGIAGQDPYKDQYGTGTAYLDPIFTLPTGLRDMIDIVGVLSDGTTPVDSGGGGVVPEPASWMMMVAGFGLVGLSMRRRFDRHALAFSQCRTPT